MAFQAPIEHAPKTLAESGLCFASIAVLLIVAAVGMQWLLHLLP